jgi:hypothetical protein
MKDWSKELWEVFDTVATEVEQFFEEVGEVVEMVADEVGTIFIEEIDLLLNDLLDPFAETYIDFDFEDEGSGIDTSITYKVNPTLQKNPACIGCKHYHGYAYGGKLLVCGMHPYGWDGEQCPDWEEGQPQSSYYQDLF